MYQIFFKYTIKPKILKLKSQIEFFLKLNSTYGVKQQIFETKMEIRKLTKNPIFRNVPKFANDEMYSFWIEFLELVEQFKYKILN